MENFKDIPGYEGVYSINTEGIIKSYDRWVRANMGSEMLIKSRLFTGWKASDKYIRVKLSNNGVSRAYGIHYLLALTFIPNPENLPIVLHWNDIKDDNRLENLRWGTRKDNAYDQMRNGIFKTVARKGEDHYLFGKKGKDNPLFGRKRGYLHSWAKLVLDTQNGIFYDCIKDAANSKGISGSTLSNMFAGRSKNWTGLILA